MSRIGKKPVAIPTGVNVTISDRVVTVEKGGNRLSMTHRPEVSVEITDDKKSVCCTIAENKMKDKPCRAYWGLTRALIQNMIEGVTKGYEKKLEVVGVGWGAKIQGQTLQLNVGYCNPVEMPIPAGLDVQVERQIITVKGCDKQMVGQFAAAARSKRKPEPYNGKGVRYFGEQIIRKEGKSVVGR